MPRLPATRSGLILPRAEPAPVRFDAVMRSESSPAGRPAELLRAERAGAVARLDALRAELGRLLEESAGAGVDDEHDIEGASLPFEREQVRATLREAAARLAEIDAALARLAAGTYGTCEACGEPIAARRLEARPSARTCVRCASRAGR